MSVARVEFGDAHLASAEWRKQACRFLVVGGSSVAVDLVCYCVLLNFSDRTFAKGLAYLAGVLVGFVGNKKWTFESRERSLTEPMLYVAVYTTTLLVNVVINSSVASTLASQQLSAVTVQICAFIAATGVTTVMNFLGLKFIAFRQAQMDRKFHVKNRTPN